MDPFFTSLGWTVYERWKKKDFSLPAFPEIAVRALKESNPSGQVNLSALTREFLLEEDQPFQSPSGFGQPEIIVYDNTRFYIQLLFWLDGTTDIHQHSFSGAFHVMAGSSIHSRFEFENEDAVTAHFRTGNLILRKAELLTTGSTVPITSGHGCIHSLFHLETPSVTVVIRTHGDPGTGPQFTYLPPHVAIDPVRNDPLTLRRKQLLDLIEQTADPAYPDLATDMISSLDFERGFFILQNCIGHLRALGAWDPVWQAFVNRHGSLSSKVLPTLEEIIRRDTLVAMRANIVDPEHRFFVALLLNLQDREKILRFVGRCHSGNPLSTIMRWAEELLQPSPYGAWILDARFPMILNVEEEDQPGLLIEALEQFLKGTPAKGALISLAKKDREVLNAAIAKSSWGDLHKS